jgi:hypothetical protein
MAEEVPSGDQKGEVVIVDFANDAAGSGVNLKRKAEIDARMKQREEELKKKHNEGTGSNSSRSDPQQIAKNFDTQFTTMKKEMTEKLEQARSGKLSADELTTQFDYVIDLIPKMKSILVLSASSLNSYDLQQSQKYIDGIEQEVAKSKEELLPKKKFAFSKNKKKATSATTTENSNMTSNSSISSSVDIIGKTVKDISDQILVYTQNDDFTFMNIKNSAVYIICVSTAVRIAQATNCKFYFGPVTGSVFIDKCDHCVFNVASRQIRIHTTQECDFYLNVQSRPTIEHCNGIRFAPYAFEYESRSSDFSNSGFNDKDNQWQDVQDFNWLKPNSPNWSVIGEADRVAQKYVPSQ